MFPRIEGNICSTTKKLPRIPHGSFLLNGKLL